MVPGNARGVEHRHRGAPGLPDGGITAGQQKGFEMGGMPHPGGRDDEEFTAADHAAPGVAVAGGVARAVKAGDKACPGSGRRRRSAEVLGDERGHVGLVVLHPHKRNATGGGKPLRPLSRQIAGMKIGRDRRGRGSEESQQVLGRPLDRGECLEAAHVADVLAHDRPVANGQAERGFEFPADSENWRAGCGQPDRQGRVAPGKPDRQRCTSHAPHN